MNCNFLQSFPTFYDYKNYFAKYPYDKNTNEYSIFLQASSNNNNINEMCDAFSLNLNFAGEHILGGVYDGFSSSKNNNFWKELSHGIKRIAYKGININNNLLKPDLFIQKFMFEIDDENLSTSKKLAIASSIVLTNIKNSSCKENYQEAKEFLDEKMKEYNNLSINNHAYEVASSFEKIFLKHYQKEKNIHDVFKKTYHEISNNLEKLFSYGGVRAANFLIKDNTIYHANVGDCQCAIISKNKVMPITVLDFPHPMYNKNEYERLQELGANFHMDKSIYYIKIANGDLYRISRAIGNKKGKEYGIIPTPHTGKYVVKPDDRFLIVASDGFLAINNFSKENDYLYPILKDINKAGDIQEAISKYNEEERLVTNLSDNKSLMVIPLN